MLKELYDGSRTERDEASGHESVRRTRILGVDGGIATVTTITTTTGSPSRQSVSPKRIVFAEGHTVMSLPTVRSDSETSSSGTQREVAAALNGVEPEPETYTTTITTAPVSNDPLDTSPHRTPRQRQPPQPWGNAAGIPPSSSLADAILSADLPAAHVPSRRPTKLAAELDGAPVQRPAQFRRESRPEGITPKIGSRDQAAQIGWTGPAPPPQPSAGALSFDVVGEAGVGQLVLYPAASSLRRVPSRDFFDAGPPPKARLAARASPPRQPVLGRALSSPGRLVDRRAARPPQPVAVGRRDTLGSSHGPGSVQDDDYHVWDETVSSSLKSSVRNDPLAERERHRPWRQRSGAALLIPEHAQASKSLMSTPTSGLGLDQGSDSGEHDVTVLIDDQHDVVVLIDDSAAGQTDNNQSLHALPIGSPRLVKFDNSGGRDADGLFPEVQTPCGAVEDIITESAKPSSSLRRPPSRPNGLKTPRTPRGPDCPSPAQSRSPSGAMQRYSTSPSPPFSSSPRSARSVTPPPLRSFGRSAVSPDSPTNEREVAFRNVGGMTLTLTLASDGTVRVSEQEENPDSPRVRNRDPVTQVTLDRCGMLMKVEPAALSFHILPEHEPLLHRLRSILDAGRVPHNLYARPFLHVKSPGSASPSPAGSLRRLGAQKSPRDSPARGLVRTKSAPLTPPVSHLPAPAHATPPHPAAKPPGPARGDGGLSPAAGTPSVVHPRSGHAAHRSPRALGPAKAPNAAPGPAVEKRAGEKPAIPQHAVHPRKGGACGGGCAVM